MNTVRINISKEIGSPSALTREQGKIIYDKINNYIENDTFVILDFIEIESLITPFLNVSIGKLYEKYTSEIIKKYINIINIPEGKASSFNLVIENAKKYYSNKDSFNKAVRDVID